MGVQHTVAKVRRGLLRHHDVHDATWVAEKVHEQQERARKWDTVHLGFWGSHVGGCLARATRMKVHGQSKEFSFRRAVSRARVTRTPTRSARRSFLLGYKKRITLPLVDSVSSRWVILERSGFSPTKPLEFLAHATSRSLH